MKGKIPWNVGIKHSEESKKKMSESHKGKKNSELHISLILFLNSSEYVFPE